MYAQCPECLTFFHLKPAHLKAAGGRVRCSQCKHVFNALETLRDELTPEEIAAVEELRRREPKTDEPEPKEEYAGDLFDGLDYIANEELGLDEPEPAGAMSEPVEPEIASSELPATPLREVEHFAPPRRRGKHQLLFGLANLLLVLLLGAQFVHAERHDLVERPFVGPHLARLYATIGHPLTPPPDLGALQVSRTEVASHPEHPRALSLTAVLENSGRHAQPWPVLYVDLQDRWGDSVGSRYFEPVEYLRRPEIATHPFAAGTRAAIDLAIMDPGSAAVGFQVEACFSRPPGYMCPRDSMR